MATNILRLSTDLQSELIRKLIIDSDLYNLLDSIVAKAEEVLQADASSIYVLDPQVGPEGNRTAIMRAARGYPSYIDAIHRAQCIVIPSEDVPSQPGDDEKLGLTGWVVSTGRSFLAKSPDDVFQHPHWLGKYDDLQMPMKQLRLAAFLAVPLRDPRGRVIGALKAERVEGKDAFSVEDQIVRLPAAIDDAERLVTMDLASGELRELVRHGKRTIFGNPSGSPDGRQIAFSSNWRVGHQIYVVDLRTRESRRISSLTSGGCEPRFMRDGRVCWVNRGHLGGSGSLLRCG